jgi:uncharacterized spore protein YtfJ
MSSPAPFAPVAELIERTVSIRHVYGDVVTHGDVAVIPVASVAYGFGAGGGRGAGRRMPVAATASPDVHRSADGEGAGGGGGVRMTPVGVLEIGPEGTRFIRFRPIAPLLAVGAIGLGIGWLLGHR